MNARDNDTIKTLCITVGGSGFAPFASGTWGSLAALVPFIVLWQLSAYAQVSRPLLEALILLGVVLACIPAVRWGPWAIARFGRKDPKQFVLDEFAGQWVALLLMPVSLSAGLFTLAWVIGGQFLLFRIMDIIKPPPARQLERYPAGWGVLLDDLAAGVYANIVGQLVWRLSPASDWLGLDAIAWIGGS